MNSLDVINERKSKEFVSVSKAEMITNVPYYRILYAINDDIILHSRVGKHLLVNPPDIQQRRIDQLMNSVGEMIIKTLKKQGRFENTWIKTWEDEEETMTELEYELWIREKIAATGGDATMGDEEKVYWKNKGLCVSK